MDKQLNLKKEKMEKSGLRKDRHIFSSLLVGCMLTALFQPSITAALLLVIIPVSFAVLLSEKTKDVTRIEVTKKIGLRTLAYLVGIAMGYGIYYLRTKLGY